MSKLDYQHPGKLFITQYGPVTEDLDVTQYASFLRQEANMSEEPPIDLIPIFNHFGITPPKRISLPGQSGLLLNPDSGIIFINEDDPTTRQRFSEAHELMELLFAAQSRPDNRPARDLFSEAAKEKLCEKGAAELLMPLSSFVAYVQEWGVSLETGKRLAGLYNVSFTAALLRTVQFGPGQHALVLWKLAHKPSEEKPIPHPDQICLFEDYTPQPPPKKLRVQWACSTQDRNLFIPRYKSVEPDTSLYRAYNEDATVKAIDWIDLGSISGFCYCESMVVTVNEEKHVLSVIHLPKDEHSISELKSLS